MNVPVRIGMDTSKSVFQLHGSTRMSPWLSGASSGGRR